MKRPAFPGLVARAAASLFPVAQGAASAAPETSAPQALEAWVPDDVIGFAKLNGLGERLEAVLESGLRRELESMALVKVLLSQEPWQKFQDHLSQFRSGSGKDPVK